VGRGAGAHSRIGRVVFLYPTRGTATEGFRDYVAWAPETEASLLHGTARYELESIAESPGETPAARGRRFAPSDDDERLFALAYWSRRFFSATVDQFLGFLEHDYRGLCLLPVLADSAVVIDEVHSFDEHLFKDLVAFLAAFDVPVLCMTATMEASRRGALEAVGLRVYPGATERADLADLAAEEEAPRYRIDPVASADEARARVLAAYEAGARILWVVNTVDRCQALARDLASRLGAPILAYHSRFTLADRKTVHDAVVGGFQQRSSPKLAVTTQVCEMSLDLDADVLVTEIAPVPSLVQRFGRSNRKREGKPESFRAEVLVYEPPRAAPYDREELAAARAFLDVVRGGDVSQQALAEALVQFAPGSRRRMARRASSRAACTPRAARCATSTSTAHPRCSTRISPTSGGVSRPARPGTGSSSGAARRALRRKRPAARAANLVPRGARRSVRRPLRLREGRLGDMTTTAPDKAVKRSRTKKPAADATSVLTLRYALAELTSAQHRAGLAGLVLMAQWLGRCPRARAACVA